MENKTLNKWLKIARGISTIDELTDLMQDMGLDASMSFSKQTLISYIKELQHE